VFVIANYSSKGFDKSIGFPYRSYGEVNHGEETPIINYLEGVSMENSIVEKTIDMLSGWFLNGVIVAVWALAILVLTQMEYPAAFQIWPILVVLGMIALSLPFAMAMMLKGGFTHSHRKSIF
jgi:hypothetical protein